MNLREKVIKSTTVFEGTIFNVSVKEVELPNGKHSTRDVVEHKGAVCILPVTAEGNVILERQYRISIDEIVYEIPAGRIEEGEDPKEAAYRELEEETGYKAGKMDDYTFFYSAVGYSSEPLYIYIATNLEKTQTNLDEDEFLEIVEFTPSELKEMLFANKFTDNKTAGLIARYLLEIKIK